MKKRMPPKPRKEKNADMQLAQLAPENSADIEPERSPANPAPALWIL